MAILTVNNISKVFGGLVANSDISFRVKENEIVGLIGPNGAGKTTCFNLISGFIPPSDGTVILGSETITHLTPHQIASLGMIRTFQHTNVFSNITVLENIRAGQHLQAKKLLGKSLFNRKDYRKEDQKLNIKAEELLFLMGLEEKKNKKAIELPYGDQRMLEIAIALAAEPKLLLLDEPAAGLNDTESANLVKILKELKADGLSVLIVEHDMKVVMNLCDYIVVLDQGKKIAEGTPQEVRNNQKVIDVYLGASIDENQEEFGEVQKNV